jgi:hypothetical protein
LSIGYLRLDLLNGRCSLFPTSTEDTVHGQG